tara:strand:+ start:1441 stop:2085 length:645 start_codon:yes stop_codon:yes gene_type:complete
MKLQDKEGLEIASTVKDVLEGKVKKENKKKVQEVEEPRAKGEKEFKGKHVRKVSGMRPDGTNIKEKKLKAGRGKTTIDVDHTGQKIPEYERKYKIKFKKNRFGGMDVTGEKKNILAYMQAADGHGVDSDEIEELYPELLEAYKKAKKEEVDEEELEDDKEEADEQSKKQEKYQKFFNAALKKFGVKSPAELEGDKKKEFFDYVDKNYEGDNEAD